MIESRAKWGELIDDVGLKITQMYDQGDMLYTPGVSNILRVQTMDKAQENYTGKTSFGEIKKFEDGDAIPDVERFKTYNTSITAKNYGGKVAITKNQIEDRSFDADLDEFKDISRSTNYSVDKSGSNVYNSLFSTSSANSNYNLDLYGDGVATASTVHPTVVPGASTQSNASSTGITLGIDNFETGELALENQAQDNGLPITMTGRITLVTADTLQRTAKEITMSQKNPENANNVINVFNGAYDLVTSKLLNASNDGSATQWTLVKMGDAKIFHKERQAKQLHTSVDANTLTTTFAVEARWTDAVLDFRGIWASKGNGASYTG